MQRIPPIHRRKSVTGQSAGEDRLLAMVAALTSELAVTRERLDTVERLLNDRGLVDQAAIETFTPGSEAVAERDTVRRRLISRVFRPLREDARQKECNP